MNNKTVFISHSSADDIISEKTYQYLENLGIGCWMDKHDIVPGIPYARAIIQGLDMCKAMVILLTSNSITSDDVLNELESAKRRGMLFISVFIEDIKLPEEFEYYLNRKQWITAFDDIDKGLKSLANALAKNLNITLIDKEAEERERKIKEAKKDLIRLAEEYHSLGIEQSKQSHKIEDKMRFAGITHRICPVCESSVNLDSSFCSTCGWTISPIYGIEGAEYLLSDKNVQIDLMKSVWNKAGDSSYKEMVENLKADLAKKDEELSQKSTEISKKDKEIESLHNDIQDKEEKLKDSENAISESTTQINKLQKDIEEKNAWIALYEEESKNTNKSNDRKRITQLEKEKEELNNKFKARVDKDDNEIKKLNQKVTHGEKQIKQLKDELDKLKKKESVAIPAKPVGTKTTIENTITSTRIVVTKKSSTSLSSKNDVVEFIKKYCKGKGVTQNSTISNAQFQAAEFAQALKKEYNIDMPNYSSIATIGTLAGKIFKAVATSQKKPQVSETEIKDLVFSCCKPFGKLSWNDSLAKSRLDCEKLSTSLNKKHNIALSVAEIKSCATLNAVIKKILS